VTAAPLILIGGGEHACVVADAARSSGQFDIRGFVDPRPCDETAVRLALPRLGDDAALVPSALAVLGVGAIGPSPLRRGIVDRATPHVQGWAIVVHSTAWVSPSAILAEGTVVLAGAVVNSGARIGRHCVINSGAIVEHDVVLGDFVQVAPGAVLGGGVRVGEDTFVGLGAMVRDHVRVGIGVFIGMGLVVVTDAGDGAQLRGPLATPRGVS
jgi:acetyltransferase EpsM